MVRRESIRAPWPVASVVWIVGALSLVAPPLIGWIASPPSFRIPATPVDRVNYVYARQWSLLQKATSIVPAGQTFTTIAKDKDEEMLLFMLSLGVIRNRFPVPSSYWRVPVAEGASARYVVSYECLEPTGAARVVGRFPEGCVWERSGPER